MFGKIPRWLKVGMALAFGFAGLAVVFFLTRSGKSGHEIQSPLYYNYPLRSFTDKFTMRSGNPNHPDTYSVEVGLICGTQENPQFGIKVFSSETYGTQTAHLCLNVQTGNLRVDTAVSGIEAHYDIGPPSRGGKYYDYVARLKEVKEILQFVAEGCDIPDFGFNYPARPELKGAVGYIGLVIGQLKDDKDIDAVTARLPFIGSYLRLGTEVKVAIEYKARKERDIRVRFCDRKKSYREVSLPARAGTGGIEARIPLPQSVEDADSTGIKVCIAPKGMDWSQKLDEVLIHLPSFSGDYLWNLYLTGSSNDVLHLGRVNRVYMNWQVLGTRKIMVRVLDSRGEILAKQDFLATNGREDHREVELTLAGGPQRSAEARIVARIVPKNGSWSDFLCQKEIPVRLQPEPGKSHSLAPSCYWQHKPTRTFRLRSVSM